MRSILLVALVVSTVGPLSGGAQASPASRSILKGLVIDDANERGLPGATVEIEALRVTTVTDSTGAFRLASLPMGRYVVSVKRIGYTSITAVMVFAGSDTTEADFALVKQVTKLPEVEVKTASPARA